MQVIQNPGTVIHRLSKETWWAWKQSQFHQGSKELPEGGGWGPGTVTRSTGTPLSDAQMEVRSRFPSGVTFL